MNRKSLVVLLPFVVAAFGVGSLVWITQSPELKWAAAAMGLSILSLGLGAMSLSISSHTEHTDERINELNDTLARIEASQAEMQREQREQQEQSSSSSKIVPTLQAFSQLYLDYLANQKGEDEQQDAGDDAKGSKEA